MVRFFVRSIVIASMLPAMAAAQDPMAEVQRIADAAHQEGLPARAIINRAKLGTQAMLPPGTIVAAARRERDRLAEARSVLGANAPEPDLVAASGALLADIHRTSIKRIRDARPAGSVAVALGVLTQLVSDGAAEKSAADAVAKVMQRVADPQLLAWGDKVRSDARAMKINIDKALELQVRSVVAAYPTAGSGFTALEATGVPTDPRLGTGTPPKIIRRPPDK